MGAARLLVAEGGTALDWQGLVDGDKGARHGRVARQEERPALLDDSCEPVADRVHPQVWSVVANSNHDRRLPAFGCKQEVVRVCGKNSLTKKISMRWWMAWQEAW